MIVRRASHSDHAVVTNLFDEYFDAIALPRELRDDTQAVAVYLDTPRAIFLAYDGALPAGVIALRPLEPQPTGALGPSCEVKRLYVRPSCRRSGVAGALLDALETYARSIGFREAYLDTRADMTAAFAFYLQRGYIVCERYNDNPVAAHFLRLPL